MVVIDGLVGAGGLGAAVVRGISTLDVGAGFEGGIAMVILAIYLDQSHQRAGDSPSTPPQACQEPHADHRTHHHRSARGPGRPGVVLTASSYQGSHCDHPHASQTRHIAA